MNQLFSAEMEIASSATRLTSKETSSKVESTLEHAVLRLGAEDGLVAGGFALRAERSLVEKLAVLLAEADTEGEELLSPKGSKNLSGKVSGSHVIYSTRK